MTAVLPMTLAAQTQRRLDPDRYIYPVLNVAGLCSANFGEMRPNHFHSGVDIKTDGTEGKPVVATADGYVARIVVSPSGYGKALYVIHPHDGTMSVYGHLSRFRSDLDSLASARRLRTRKNAIDIWMPEGDYPVKQGETIALSGNTGNSFGPHLHFEIRDMRDNTTLNLIRQGIIPVRDTVPPIIQGILYEAVDSAGGMPVHSYMHRIGIKKTARGRYEATATVKAAPEGYFTVEVSDRKNDVQNRFGIYRITQYIDGRPTLEYRADGFRLEDSRYCNAVSCYPLQLNASCEVIRMAVLEGCPEKFYSLTENRGTVKTSDGSRHHIKIEVEDDCGNISTLDLDVEPGSEAPKAADIPETDIIRRGENFTRRFEDVTVTIPAGALYETTAFKARRTQLPRQTALEVLTPVYEIMSDKVPVHTSVTISVRAFIPADLRKHAAMAVLSPKGQPVYAGGSWRDGAMECRSSKFGTFFVTLDTTQPVIRPQFESGADMRRRSAATFAVSDDFSGIKEYSASIDGLWTPVDWNPLRGTMSVKFDHSRYPYDSRHEIVLTVTDNCGNTAEWHGSFFR